MVLYAPSPNYPAVSIRLGEEGRVECAIVVGADGLVIAVEIRRSSGHPRLDRAASAALRQWRFVPARRNGRPSSGRVEHTVRFRLE